MTAFFYSSGATNLIICPKIFVKILKCLTSSNVIFCDNSSVSLKSRSISITAGTLSIISRTFIVKITNFCNRGLLCRQWLFYRHLSTFSREQNRVYIRIFLYLLSKVPYNMFSQDRTHISCQEYVAL